MGTRLAASHVCYAALVVVGALNRETTGLLLAGAYACVVWRQRPSLRGWALLYGALAIGMIALVRLSVGAGNNPYTPGYIFQYNLGILLIALLYLVPMLGGWWWLAARGMRRAPPFLRSLVPLALLYGAFVLVFGSWREVRLLVPILPLLLAYGLVSATRR